MAVFYVAGQLLGGFIGFGVLKLITPKHIWRPEDATGPGVCTTVPHPDLSPFTAVTVEFIITSVLIFLCCGVWDSRNAKHHDSVPLRFGLTITGLALAGARFSGGNNYMCPTTYKATECVTYSFCRKHESCEISWTSHLEWGL